MNKVGERDASLFYPTPIMARTSFLSEVTSTDKEAGLPPSDPADDGAWGVLIIEVKWVAAA